jgi:beta-ureidopropionase
MSKNDVSRRSFLSNSIAGVGLIGLGATPSDSFSQHAGPGISLRGPVNTSPREVWVMSIAKSGLEESKDVVKGMIDRIRIMASYKPDIICLPELFTGKPATEAEEIPGPTTSRLAEVAKELGSYIICPLHAKRDDKAHNSAVLIDREGNMAGRYDKIHPVSVESKKGAMPGSFPPPVFKTDFGTIGIQICFDINWVDSWKSLKEQGAEIVFWPSAYPAGRMLPSYAWIFKYYVVGCSWRDPATVYDMTGDLIAESGQWQHCAFAKLNLEKAFLEIANYSAKLNEMKKKYGRKVLIRYYNPEDWVTIESCSPDLRIKDLLSEYELVPHWDYIKQEEKEQEKYRTL